MSDFLIYEWIDKSLFYHNEKMLSGKQKYTICEIYFHTRRYYMLAMETKFK